MIRTYRSAEVEGAQMLNLRKLAAGVAAAATRALVATAVPALADPPTGSGGKAVVPASYDVVGVGANTAVFSVIVVTDPAVLHHAPAGTVRC